MARDYPAEALEIARALDGIGRSADASAVREAVHAASTGTEMLMAISWHMKQLVGTGGPMPPSLEAKARELAEAIDAALRR